MLKRCFFLSYLFDQTKRHLIDIFLPKRQLKKDIFSPSFRYLFTLSKRWLKKDNF